MEIYAAKPGTVMTSGLDGVIQLSHMNEGVEPAWGKSVSLSLEERLVPGAGLADAAQGLRSGKKVSADCGGAWRAGLGGGGALGRGRRR